MSISSDYFCRAMFVKNTIDKQSQKVYNTIKGFRSIRLCGGAICIGFIW